MKYLSVAMALTAGILGIIALGFSIFDDLSGPAPMANPAGMELRADSVFFEYHGEPPRVELWIIESFTGVYGPYRDTTMYVYDFRRRAGSPVLRGLEGE